VGTVFKTAILYWFASIKAAKVQTDNKQTNKIKVRTRPERKELITVI
jgi:hypothetical protein